MKILFVCQQYIHSVRWINQLKNSEHEIFVFDCLDKPIHEGLLWTNYETDWSKRKIPVLRGEYFLEKRFPRLFRAIEPMLKITASEKLYELIQEIKPDLVHSLEMQSETYPLLKVRRKLPFKWAYFSWGSDLYLYQHQQDHQHRIKAVLRSIDFLFTDNKRDVNLAKELGFNGVEAPVFPGGGGYELAKYKPFIKPINERKTILIKGYHHWAGKALFVLEALTLIINDIEDYDIYVYSAHNQVIERIEELNDTYKLNICYSSRFHQISQNQLLEKFGKSIVAIGNNSSDGIPNTLLESMICGAFPIQSNPGKVTEEYITHGENGLLINQFDDIHQIAQNIKEVLSNKALITEAFKINQELVKNLKKTTIEKKVLEVYKEIESYE